MDIKYLGHSSFLIKTKQAKLVTDPFSPESTGLKWAKQEADIVTISHDHEDHNYREGVKGEPLVISWPGEFEKKEVRITGFATYHDATKGTERGNNVIYKIEDEDISVLHCGDLGHVIDDTMVEEIGSVDVLMIPVGGVYSLGPKEAGKIVNAIEPSIVIPMHYQQDGLRADVFGELSPVAQFLHEMGADEVAPIEKLTVKKESFNPDQVQIVTLSI